MLYEIPEAKFTCCEIGLHARISWRLAQKDILVQMEPPAEHSFLVDSPQLGICGFAFAARSQSIQIIFLLSYGTVESELLHYFNSGTVDLLMSSLKSQYRDFFKQL